MSSDQFSSRSFDSLAPPADFDRKKADRFGCFFFGTILAFLLFIFAVCIYQRAYGQDSQGGPHIQSIDYTNVAIPTYPRNPIPVTIYRVHDADTITDCTIHLPFDVDLPHRALRCYGFDAWEVSKVRHSADAGPITDDEINRGFQAKDALVQLLLTTSKSGYAENRLYVEYVLTKDPYGRYDCWWWIKSDSPDGPTWLNVAAWGRANGHQRIKMQDSK